MSTNNEKQVINNIDDAEHIELKLDEGYSDFEGWGTSLAWWGHAIGGWEDKQAASEVMDLIFDREKGLGLNIVRYNIGGGENPEYNTMRPGGDVPGFQPSEGEWDWEADGNQRSVLLGAIARGVNLAEAFSNSPPYWMTVSGSVTGAEDGGNNLQEEHYERFADYLTEVVRVYRDKWGVTFHSLNPLNEPSSAWWIKGNIQEGAHFDIDKQARILKLTEQSLKQKGLIDTIVSAPDDNSIDETIDALEEYGDEVLAILGQVNVHSYNGSKMEELKAFVDDRQLRLWMSEYGTGGSGGHDHEDMTSVMELAERIMVDLKVMRPSAWVYWQAVENEGANNNWGFIHANFEGEESYAMTKQYYAMAQFTKFIAPGSTIASTTDGRTIASYEQEQQKLTLITRNEHESSRMLTFKLPDYVTVDSNIAVNRTSIYENFFELSNVATIDKDILYIEAIPHSITSIAISAK